MPLTIDPVGYSGTSGVCPVCHGDAKSWPRCWSCANNIKILGLADRVPEVYPLGLGIKSQALAVALWNYKRGDTVAQRTSATRDLQALIDERLPHLLGHVKFDLVCHVPGRRSGGHSVRELFAGTAWGAAQDFADILIVQERELDTHKPDANRFGVRCPLHGQRVLLLDDTFTTGSTTFAAASALLQAGAAAVSIVVVGRHADTDYLTEEYMENLRGRRQRGEFCPACTTTLSAATRAPAQESSARPATTSPRDVEKPWAAPWSGTSEPIGKGTAGNMSSEPVAANVSWHSSGPKESKSVSPRPAAQSVSHEDRRSPLWRRWLLERFETEDEDDEKDLLLVWGLWFLVVAPVALLVLLPSIVHTVTGWAPFGESRTIPDDGTALGVFCLLAFGSAPLLVGMTRLPRLLAVLVFLLAEWLAFLGIRDVLTPDAADTATGMGMLSNGVEVRSAEVSATPWTPAIPRRTS